MYEAFIDGFSTFVMTFGCDFFSDGDIKLAVVAAGESAQDLAIKATFLTIILFHILTKFWLSWRSFAYDVLWYVLINILSFLSLFFEHSLQALMSPPPHRRIRQSGIKRSFSPVLLTVVLLAIGSYFYASSSMLLSCFLYLWVGWAVEGYLFQRSIKPPHTLASINMI